MSRYIDADAHVARMRELYCKDCSRRKGMKNGKMKFIYPIGGLPCRACEFGDAIDAIDDAPTVDAVPVVHAHWIHTHTSSSYWTECYKCSACGYEDETFMGKKSDYCSACGAVMDGKENNDE